MALTSTTLLVACDATTNQLQVTAATGATVGGIMKINDEYMVIAEIADVAITVRSRGEYGTCARAHAILSPVTFGTIADVPAPGDRGSFADRPPRDVITIGADGAIPVPVRDTVVLITKATAIAATLADPSADLDGVILRIASTTAAAHVVTLATGPYAGTERVFTFPEVVGAAISLIASRGAWAYLTASLDPTETEGAYVALADP